MAATLTIPPLPVSHSRNPHFVQLTTSFWTGSTSGFFAVEFFVTGMGGPAPGQQISFLWEGKVVTMTAATTPDASGTQFPAYSGQPQNDYVLAVEEAFRQNALLDEYFDFQSLSGAYQVELFWKKGGQIDLAINGTITNGTLTATDGGASFSQPNTSALLRLYDDSTDRLIEPLGLAYDPKTGKAECDLSGLFEGILAPHLPDSTTLLPASGNLPSGVAFRAFGAFYLRFADRFGNPIAAQGLQKSALFRVVFGALAADHDGGFNYAGVFACHNYRKKNGQPITKTVAPDQPDWVFVYSTFANGFYVDYVVTWSDGSTSTHGYSGGNSALFIDEHQLRWIPSGFAQSKLGSIVAPSSGLEIVGYRWRLRSQDDGAIAVFVDYELACDCSDWGLFLALDNGLGGIETVHLRGKATRRYEAERDEFRRTRWRDWLVTEGDSGQFGAEARHVIEVSTGWIEREWAQHLRQLLLGRCWLIDMERQRFEAVAIDTKSLAIEEDDQELFEITFTMRSAWSDSSFNHF